jgi:D-sedoheptulose 7-phosphate isomerase
VTADERLPTHEPGTTLASPRDMEKARSVDEALAEAARLVAWLSSRDARVLLEQFSDVVAGAIQTGGRVLACGNGGSMCDAMHFAEELSGRFRQDRPALAAQAISDPAHLTCVANDWGFDRVFARGIEAWGRRGDVLVVFSTSGQSANVIAAAEAARERGLTVLGLLGRDGGALKLLCDRAVVVPARTSDRIQEIHIKVVHLVIELVERRLFPQLYATDESERSIA